MERGRVIAAFKDRYEVRTLSGVYQSEVLGNLRFTAASRSDLPAVGDWVQIDPFDEAHAIIHSIDERKNVLERQAVGAHGEKQLIATNVDTAFIVQGLDRDFNINRIERYLTLCHAHDIEPIVLLNKADLIDENQLSEILESLSSRIFDLPILVMSNVSGIGLQAVKEHLIEGKTYCLLGSSGVGKSTLINQLLGEEALETQAISASTQKGRHTTTHRQLFTLPNGSYIIDNPGMREVGMTDDDAGIEETFSDIHKLAKACKFSDCTHTTETGCKVLEALEAGALSHDQYDNFLRLNREKEHFQATVAEKRKKGKDLAKLIKQHKKGKYKG